MKDVRALGGDNRDVPFEELPMPPIASEKKFIDCLDGFEDRAIASNSISKLKLSCALLAIGANCLGLIPK